MFIFCDIFFVIVVVIVVLSVVKIVRRVGIYVCIEVECFFWDLNRKVGFVISIIFFIFSIIVVMLNLLMDFLRKICVMIVVWIGDV